jgi:hypothetical protein
MYYTLIKISKNLPNETGLCVLNGVVSLSLERLATEAKLVISEGKTEPTINEYIYVGEGMDGGYCRTSEIKKIESNEYEEGIKSIVFITESGSRYLWIASPYLYELEETKGKTIH